MPTVLQIMGQETPQWVEGMSLLPRAHDRSVPGREFTVTTVPFANPGDPVSAVDNIRRRLATAPVTTVTADEWALVHSVSEGLSELYHLPSDPAQNQNVIFDNPQVARDIHQYLVKFMRDTNLPEALLKPRLELRI